MTNVPPGRPATQTFSRLQTPSPLPEGWGKGPATISIPEAEERTAVLKQEAVAGPSPALGAASPSGRGETKTFSAPGLWRLAVAQRGRPGRQPADQELAAAGRLRRPAPSVVRLSDWEPGQRWR